MSATRKPARPSYDAVVELANDWEQQVYAYALVKFTYEIQAGRCELAAPECLLHDIHDPKLQPRIPPATDYWPLKEATDFVVQGAAHAPNRRPTRQMEVSVQVGPVKKRITVFGKRSILWNGSGPRIGDPEPFDVMPLTYDNAYGGIDWRVPIEAPESFEKQVIDDSDHPGLYPRNPFGKGYLVEPGPVPKMEMPNLEDPDDCLTADRLIVGDAKLWYRQPLPWCFDWVHPIAFPRQIFFAAEVDAWFPGPEDAQMPEVRRGFLPAGYRTAMSQRQFVEGPDPRFYQGASLGLVLPRLAEEEIVTLMGMHPVEPSLRFALPRPPRLEIIAEGNRQAVPARLHTVVCKPEEKRVSLLWAGHRLLPRPFLPGIHKRIPVAVSVNGDAPVPYQTPPTYRDQIAAARKP